MNSEATAFYNEIESALSQIDFTKERDKSISGFRLSPPSEHERQVIQALEWFLSNDRESFLDYRVTKWSRMPEVTPDTYDMFRDTFQSYLSTQRAALILKWAILLHDIGKGRGAAEPHSETSAKIAQKMFAVNPQIGGLNDDERKFIVWIVRHHDVMGNINTGERAADYLFRITKSGKPGQTEKDGEFCPEWKKGLDFLQFSMLCDLRGTSAQGQNGGYLTDAKARFWLKLSNLQTIHKLTSGLYSYRVKRWTGGLDGFLRPSESKLLRYYVNSRKSQVKKKIIEYFGKRISHIVNGYYLLDALDSREMAELMERVVMASGLEKAPVPEEARLEFTMGYRKGDPASEEMLRRAKESLGCDNTSPLRVEYIPCETIIVHTRGLIEKQQRTSHSRSMPIRGDGLVPH